MGLLSMEHGRISYFADFAAYGLAGVCLVGALIALTTLQQWPFAVLLIIAGGALWTLVEYLVHRFVFHGLQPFRAWHGAHHQRPHALIGTPTVLTGTLFALLVFLPALWWMPCWVACAVTLGMVAGYLAYTGTHHAVHHWQAQGAWLRQRQRAHALHHHCKEGPAQFGVTTTIWDALLGTAHTPSPRHTSKPSVPTQAGSRVETVRQHAE